jgi:microcystin-dependent protein
MKLQIVTVHLEIPARVKRWVLRLGIGAAIVVGGAAVAFASPAWTNFQSGATLTATQLNDNFSIVAPPGTIVAYAGAIDGNPGETLDGGASVRLPPSGWLLCDGMQLNGLAYAALYQAIGTAYGGDLTSQSFRLPDLRGQFLRGVDGSASHDPDHKQRGAAAAGGNAGNLVGSVQGGAAALPSNPFVTNTIPAHNHGGWTGTENSGYPVWYDCSGCQNWAASQGSNWGMGHNSHNHSIPPDGAHGHTVTSGGDSETRPTNVYVNYIIKY